MMLHLYFKFDKKKLIHVFIYFCEYYNRKTIILIDVNASIYNIVVIHFEAIISALGNHLLNIDLILIFNL